MGSEHVKRGIKTHDMYDSLNKLGRSWSHGAFDGRTTYSSFNDDDDDGCEFICGVPDDSESDDEAEDVGVEAEVEARMEGCPLVMGFFLRLGMQMEEDMVVENE